MPALYAHPRSGPRLSVKELKTEEIVMRHKQNLAAAWARSHGEAYGPLEGFVKQGLRKY